MHPNVARIIELLPPPEVPKFNKGDWREVEAELGTPLPHDFMDFIEVYGAVGICNVLWLHDPFYFVGKNAYIPLTSKKLSFLEVINEGLEELGSVSGGRDNVPFPDFPEPGGLLPCGATNNGDLVFWITQGTPDDWGVFFWRFGGHRTFIMKDSNITDFLLGLLTLASPVIPEGLAREWFEPENRRIDQ